MASKFQTFLAVTVIGSIWIGAFSAAGIYFAPEFTPSPSKQTLGVQEHFAMLAKQQRKLLGFDAYYEGKEDPRKVKAILDFTTRRSIPIRAPALDGFLTEHVNVSRGSDGTKRVFAELTRTLPYIWPRTLDVQMGMNQTVRCDLEEDLSSEHTAIYTVESHLQLKMPSPNGQFAWLTSKDNNELNAEGCLYRQDLYKDGEYYKSIIAVAKPQILPTDTMHPSK